MFNESEWLYWSPDMIGLFVIGTTTSLVAKTGTTTSIQLLRNFCTILALTIKFEIMDRFWCSRCLNNHINIHNMIGSFKSGATASLVAKYWTKRNIPGDRFWCLRCLNEILPWFTLEGSSPEGYHPASYNLEGYHPVYLHPAILHPASGYTQVELHPLQVYPFKLHPASVYTPSNYTLLQDTPLLTTPLVTTPPLSTSHPFYLLHNTAPPIVISLLCNP